MLNIGLPPQVQGNPACGSCGGTGYVYLWSIPRDGPRLWFCDRSGCKRSWTEAPSSSIQALPRDAVAEVVQPPSLPSEGARVLQPA
jgi:hypothetical protein